MIEVDIIAVYHNNRYFEMTERLEEELDAHERGRYNLVGIDNRHENRGFGPACNVGAEGGIAPVIGLLNPDTIVKGPFIDTVTTVLSEPRTVITGERFGKSQQEIKAWGCADWVCGAGMFVRRDFWEHVGGFDERYMWSWEETDLIRTAQQLGKRVQSIELPLYHMSPHLDTEADALYKAAHFNRSARLFKEKWG